MLGRTHKSLQNAKSIECKTKQATLPAKVQNPGKKVRASGEKVQEAPSRILLPGARRGAYGREGVCMQVPTNVARAVVAAQGNYDEHCKRLLSDRQVIARVLTGTLDEFDGVPVELVQAELIEGEPTIDVPMGRDDPGRPLLLADEDAVVGEGLVRFDVRARVRVPVDDGEPRLMELDVEPQGRSYLGYPIICRAFYYCGRMISQQGAGIVAGSDYGQLRKVVSVWVCLNPHETNRATVTSVRPGLISRFGTGRYDSSDYDKLEVVVIGLGPGAREAGGVVGMLATLLAKDIPPEEKLAELHNKYGIMITENIETEVRDMGGMGQAIYEDGKAQGSLERLVVDVRGAIDAFGATAEVALAAFGVPRDEWPAVIARLDPPAR